MRRVLLLHIGFNTFVARDAAMLKQHTEVTIQHWRGGRHSLADARRLRRNLRDADVVLCWFGGTHSSTAIRLARRRRIPVHVILGGYETARLPSLHYGGLHRRHERPFIRHTLRRATSLLPVAPHLGAEARAAVDQAAPITVCPSAWQPANDHETTSSRPRRGAVMVASGGTKNRLLLKGVDRFMVLARQHPTHPFHLVGPSDGGLEWARALAPANVTITPLAPFDQVSEAIAGSAVLCCLSQREGSPNVVAEAAALGTPVVASAAPGIAAVAQDLQHPVRVVPDEAWNGQADPSLFEWAQDATPNPATSERIRAAAKRRRMTLVATLGLRPQRHIIHIHKDYDPAGRGSGTGVAKLVRDLPSSWHHTVVTETPAGRRSDSASHGERCDVLAPHGAPWYQGPGGWWLQRLRRRHRLHRMALVAVSRVAGHEVVVIGHLLDGCEAAVAIGTPGVPRVGMLYGSERAYGRFRGLGERRRIGHLARRLDHITVLDNGSGFAEQTLATVSPQQASRLPVEPDTQYLDQRIIPAANHGQRRLIWTAGLRPFKGLEDALAAVGILLAQGARCHFDVYGDGDPGDAKRIGELITHLGVTDHVTLHGRVSPATIRKALGNATILLATSPTYSSLERSTMEALLLGVPAVVTDVGNVSQRARHDQHLLIVAPRDHDAIASALRQLLDDQPNWRRLGIAGRAWARAQIGARSRAERVRDIVNRLIEGA